jgi:hypothetical protein
MRSSAKDRCVGRGLTRGLLASHVDERTRVPN